MKFLTKLGQIVLKAVQIYTGFEPIAQMALPGHEGQFQVISKDLAAIAQVIGQVEAVGQVLGTPGADKLRAATPLVAQVVLQSALLANHQINDPALFQGGCQKLADGMADILNSLKDDGIQTVNKT